MAKNKIPATYTLDANVHTWINNKLGKKSTFVNRILKDAMLDEIIKYAKNEQRPKCPECKISLTPNSHDDGPEWICMYIHCKAGMV